MTRILVTGGSGFMGKHLVSALIARGREVRILDLQPPSRALPQIQYVSGASFTSLKQLQEHIDAYINAYNEKAEPFVWTKKKGPPTPIQRPPYHSALIPGTSRIGAVTPTLRHAPPAPP
jgi:hypothetical protein